MADALSKPANELARIYYPPPPWLQIGSGLFASFSVAADTVRALLPDNLTLFALPGNRAMGFVLLTRYVRGSTMQYSELNGGVLVRDGLRPVPCVLVSGASEQAACRAGAEYWNLPRQHWQFAWTFDEPVSDVQVWDGARLICRLSGVPQTARFFNVHRTLHTLLPHADQLHVLETEVNVGVSRVPFAVQMGPDGALAAWHPLGQLLTFALKGTVELRPPQPDG